MVAIILPLFYKNKNEPVTVYTAFKAAMKVAQDFGSLKVTLHLHNALTKLMQQMDYGKGYRYAHDEADGVDRGLEIKIAEKMAHLRNLEDL